MELSVEEFSELSNSINHSINQCINSARKNGVEEEKQRDKPKTLFDSMLKHAEKKKTLVGYNHEKDFKWIQVKPEREGSENVKHLEIGFDSSGMFIDVISVELKK